MMPSICAGPLSSSYLTSSSTSGRSIFPTITPPRSQMAKVKGPSSFLTVRYTSVTVVTLLTARSNLCSTHPRHGYNVFYGPQHSKPYLFDLGSSSNFSGLCCTLLRLALYFEPCSILRLSASGPQYWLKLSFLVPQRPFCESLSYFTTKKCEQRVKRRVRHERSQMWQCHISVAKPEKLESKLCYPVA
jgi:hypothetical protein